MSGAIAQQASRTKMVRNWLLAILRFAVTLEQADRAAVMAMADEMDRLGRYAEDQPKFEFFGKTTFELCTAISDRTDPNTNSILRVHLKRIEDLRLRRALEAAIEFGNFAAAAGNDSKSRTHDRCDQWKRFHR